MALLHLMLGFSGAIGRLPFVAGAIAAVVLFWAGVQGSLAALPAMAEALAPRGINAAFVLNGIWLVLGVLLVWSLAALGAKRFRDRGRWPWWAAVSVAALAALALINDTIFLVSRSFTVPLPAQYTLAALAGAIAAWVVIEGTFWPGSRRS